MSAESTLEDDPTYSHFAHREEFLKLLSELLARQLDIDPSAAQDAEEIKLVEALSSILDYYLPQPGLLDPSLGEIVPPLMNALASAVTILTKEQPGTLSRKRLGRLGKVVNWIIKVRGWKSIVPYFPSTITLLPALVQILSPSSVPSSSSSPPSLQHPLVSGEDVWELRAVILLWLSLLLTVPFDLSALGESSAPLPGATQVDLSAFKVLFSNTVSDTARDITLLTLPLLHRPGKEGSYAALALARLFARSDGVIGLSGFLSWAGKELEEGERESEANFVASLLEFLAVLPASVPHQHLTDIQLFTDSILLPHLRGSRTAASSGLVRKLAVKAKGRWWLAVLSNQKDGGRSLLDGLEDQLGDLLGSLSDKDTIVRYSSAKYLARMTALLPDSLGQQMVDATIQCFSGTDEEPVVETAYGVVVDPGGTDATEGTMGLGGLELTRGEARWHGCCLAIAEMARRALIRVQAVQQVVQWALKALMFDLRKAGHSVGANVRDAAAYLVWSLSRACTPAAIQPYAEELATRLICVACFDREVGVRRAASAAFQEGVGRLALYPEGIEVLRHTDFYSVSVRRMAFRDAAPQVARHEVYRRAMINHLHEVTIRHWDAAVQTLASEALREMLGLSDSRALITSIRRELEVLSHLDAISVRGAVFALAQICLLLRANDVLREEIVTTISKIRPAVLVSSQASDILQGIASLIKGCLSPDCCDSATIRHIYLKFRDGNIRRKEPECHFAAASLVARYSELRDVSDEVHTFLALLASGTAAQRQASALCLGAVSYRLSASSLPAALEGLLRQLEPSQKADVETRRSAVSALARVCCQVSIDSQRLTPLKLFQRSHAACISALSDYATDQRGDVGSWVRVAGIASLGQLMSFVGSLPDPLHLVDQESFDLTIACLAKQGAEKLEPVRAEVWRSVHKLRVANAAYTWQWDAPNVWDLPMHDLSDESFRYIRLDEWYLSAMPLLATKYRSSFVFGLLQSIGSQMTTTADIILQILDGYLQTHRDREGILRGILQDIEREMTENFTSNRIFIPATVAAGKLLTTVFNANDSSSELTATVSNILITASKGLATIKSVDRITAVMSLVMVTIKRPGPQLRKQAITIIPRLLSHRFPRVRSLTAEKLYLALTEDGDDVDPELEDLLLGVAWATEDVDEDRLKMVSDLLYQQLVQA
ncbi:armadillo-type protein [Kockovaella imperatae]|uniref:Armadillo-type protein n=1 Tax=Kockovaella imperatae TaxID=4999 RepID=A0A1Y1U9U1_9TREE|nr:armadillo-type protein [Kockovaella imperatae]ORX34799.1 armadillo-type protein [Kockovaella imperatae]